MNKNVDLPLRVKEYRSAAYNKAAFKQIQDRLKTKLESNIGTTLPKGRLE
jgi:hypothetical protein